MSKRNRKKTVDQEEEVQSKRIKRTVRHKKVEKVNVVVEEEQLRKNKPVEEKKVSREEVNKEEVVREEVVRAEEPIRVVEKSLEQFEKGGEEDNEVFEEESPKEESLKQPKHEKEGKGEKCKAHVSIEVHVDTIKEALKVRPVNGLVVASKHLGFLNSVRNTLGKPNGITILDLDRIYEDNQDAFGIDVAMVGALDWKWGDEAKNAYASLITVLLLRKNGGTIYKKNVQSEFKGQYQELGAVLTSLI